ncbi:MAG: hypothetical protein COB07_02650 [Sulfurovum sp.]|nr:MAG: hypothetical protein COB07_07415 [Sulfurovum sp.]PHS41390.1 MAG: hypothetical protein COB07_02650 [Sulfurovum sp.]
MSVDLNQTIAEASLDNMHDIIVPDAVGFFPVAPGWYMLIVLFLALLLPFVMKRYRRYKGEQYKREALKELSTYSEKSKENSIALLSLAKRVALLSYGRKVVAHLSHEGWWDFMEEHSVVKVSTVFREEMQQLLYDDTYSLDDAQYDRLKQTVEVWIKRHKVQKNV